LAGPRSKYCKINSEVVLLLGWGRAILLQFAHPLVAAGVAEHSLFVRQPRGRVKRLRQTVRAMLQLTFGTLDEAGAAAGGINRIHDYVQGELHAAAGPFPAGTRYSAHDPELLRWVHATLMDTFPMTYRRFVGPLSREEQEGYYREATGLEPLLGVPEGYFPKTIYELYAYLDEMVASGQIVVTDTARRLAEEVLRPPLPPLPRRLALLEPIVRLAVTPVGWLAALPAIGMLPPAIRAAYGFRWSPAHQVVLDVMSWLSRRLTLRLPALMRYWPEARAAFARSV
jgi:uncharacterized protein (DUF2236 family)